MDTQKVLENSANGNTELLTLMQTNVIEHTVFNIVRHKDDSVTFEELHDFWLHNKYVKMSRADQNLYDLFNSFRNDANAVRTLLTIAADKPALTVETANMYDKNQAKFRPETELNIAQIRGFAQFKESLTEEQVEALHSYANDYTKTMNRNKNSFENFAINTAELGFKRGDICTAFDSSNNATGFKVLQADPKGMVIGISGDDYGFVLVASAGAKIAPEGFIPADRQAKYNELFESAIEKATEIKEQRLALRGKTLEAAEAKVAKLAAKAAEKEMTIEEYQAYLADLQATRQATKEARANNFKKLTELKLDTAEDIQAAGEMFSAMELSKEQRAIVKNDLDKAKKALKEASTEATTEEVSAE